MQIQCPITTHGSSVGVIRLTAIWNWRSFLVTNRCRRFTRLYEHGYMVHDPRLARMGIALGPRFH